VPLSLWNNSHPADSVRHGVRSRDCLNVWCVDKGFTENENIFFNLFAFCIKLRASSVFFRFGILRSGHCDLFVICYLEFSIHFITPYLLQIVYQPSSILFISVSMLPANRIFHTFPTAIFKSSLHTNKILFVSLKKITTRFELIRKL